ncbi:carbohydrate ABC transporter permease [Actinacidiphila alni]|uniref:Carbohydrate ABC transporter membrane protein 2, CUT1 family n=1 Tax=Actinacidiphila alni TaxID=380248 RepID=A0A1I2H4I7_9ACTN|nr:carbohydrate ABC transporter permease [Actinacidiphila alni]SFF24602.1 carbohydrate ABC transporter membrane protein 2, CUT1 family [Actinacidiphila alni]
MSTGALKSVGSAAARPAASAVRTSRAGRMRAAATSVWTALGIVVIAVWIFPVYWMATTAFKSGPAMAADPPQLWPHSPTLVHFRKVVDDPLFWDAVTNSALVTAITVPAAVLVAFGSALAIARFRFRGRGLYVTAVMLVQMVPHVALVVPVFLTLSDVGLSDSVPGLVVTYLAFILPFAVWTLRGFIAAVPKDLEEAAMTDGCTRMGAFRHIILPLTLPGLIATSVYSMILAWNEYLFAYFIIASPHKYTVPLWLTHFVTSEGTDYGALMAGSVIVSVPVVVFFMLVQRHLAAGLTAGAVKG